MFYYGEPKPKFRVVIVGGSIAGLTLAHCLLKNNIDFVVLEAHNEIAPQVGASIGIIPNGARILDQLGVFDDILDTTEPMQESSYWTQEGNLIVRNDTPQLIHKRHGYPIAFVDRQVVLKVLYDHLADQQDRILVGKKVIKVENLHGRVQVHCADHSVFDGDLVVGADGVRSIVRQQICVFGISTAVEGLTPGSGHRTFGEDFSFLTLIGKEGRVYWFFFTKMDRVYSASEIPRFHQGLIDEHVAPYLQKPIRDTVPFAAVYERAITRTFLPLEEAEYNHWAIDRWVCVGDSAHKMTPNMGQGGNSAIESAASLANSLASLIEASGDSRVSVKDLNDYLQPWQKKRQARLQDIFKKAHELTRLEALATWKEKCIALHLFPYLTNYLADGASQTIVGATKLDCVPLPPRSLQCTMPFTNFHPPRGDAIWKRALWTVPLIGIYAVGRATALPVILNTRPHLYPLFKEGIWTAGNGEVLSLTKPLYHNLFLDKLFRPLITCFLPSITGSDTNSRVQMLSFMTDLGAVYGIWLLESYRGAHSWINVLLPLAAGTVFQLKGIWMVAPFYYTLEYLMAPLYSLLSGSNSKEIDAVTTESLALSMLAGYYSTTFANFFAPSLQSRQWYNAMWQVFPATIPLLQLPFSLARRWLSPSSPPKDEIDRKQQQRKRRQNVRYACGTFALVSGLTFIYGRFTAPPGVSFWSIFVPGLRDHLAPVTSFSDGIARFLQYDELISMGSAYVWLALRFRELKQAGARFSWTRAGAAFAASLLALGPGATFALGWGWREELLHQVAKEL
ncbi:monooxygenase [Aspergillus nomiae NRRL 13137]|uniref:Monooxygenase n=1 Tax=Aspergillus nomiae NRRL (strain ATCC 15546 / NRRL 13137 / CBS 260.88 / M93) TaxID=1509407 RepID=A0A0L1J721_ASPN3|nr:monooxygenase [Aspergillus nomiae NRRL 13137]KNG87539.1 monooxygenase [Aspergillus nomiae NRRL 13137]